jgi:CIC family chloride channel protein
MRTSNVMWKFVRTGKTSLGPLAFSFVVVLVGIVAGLGAVAFRGLIAFVHNLMFLGRLSLVYDANVHTPASPWGAFVILVPILGAVAVTFLVTKFAPEAKGHGVPEVMDSLYYGRGVIRPVVGLVKSLASSLSIGTGGSVGREGPIIQIGASFGSAVGQAVGAPLWQTSTLIAAGAAGGIAATFNTPVGGILFAVELVMREISARTLTAVAIATATATYIGRIFLGDHPSFVIPSVEQAYFHLTNFPVLISYVGLGLLAGLASVLFIKSLYGFEDFFDKRIGGGPYARHGLGMLAVGLTLYVLMTLRGHYYIEGVGYSTIQDILSGSFMPIVMLVALFALKLGATSLTLGSGASGGIFSPSLFMGATLGGAYGLALKALFPGLGIAPPAFAVAGMAGVVGGSTGAAVAAIVMIFEMTMDYTVIIPMTVTVALSYGLRKLILPPSIYTMKLVRRGHAMPEALMAGLHFVRRAGDVMARNVAILPASTTVAEFLRDEAGFRDVSDVLLESEGTLTGLVDRDAVRQGADLVGGEAALERLPARNFVVVPPDAALSEIIARMRDARVSTAVVARTAGGKVGRDDILGVIGARQIVEDIEREAEPFLD